jgi:hypothetical protein
LDKLSGPLPSILVLEPAVDVQHPSQHDGLLPAAEAAAATERLEGIKRRLMATGQQSWGQQFELYAHYHASDVDGDGTITRTEQANLFRRAGMDPSKGALQPLQQQGGPPQPSTLMDIPSPTALLALPAPPVQPAPSALPALSEAEGAAVGGWTEEMEPGGEGEWGEWEQTWEAPPI